MYIGLGAAFGCVLLVATLYYALKLQKTQGYLFYPHDPTCKSLFRVSTIQFGVSVIWPLVFIILFAPPLNCFS